MEMPWIPGAAAHGPVTMPGSPNSAPPTEEMTPLQLKARDARDKAFARVCEERNLKPSELSGMPAAGLRAIVEEVTGAPVQIDNAELSAAARDFAVRAEPITVGQVQPAPAPAQPTPEQQQK